MVPLDETNKGRGMNWKTQIFLLKNGCFSVSRFHENTVPNEISIWSQGEASNHKCIDKSVAYIGQVTLFFNPTCL